MNSCFSSFPLIILLSKITNSEEQLEQFREELENKNEEVQQLHMQLEIQKRIIYPPTRTGTRKQII